MGRRALVITLTACGAALAAVVGITLAGGPAGNRYLFDRLRFRRDTYRYVVYVPSSRHSDPGMPLVVVLHGCTMTADEQAAATGYDQIATERGFVVLYPDVDAVDRANAGCWKGLWDPGAEGRDRGDAGAIAAMTRAVIARWRIDPSRVYATGISAGGFEASMLGAAYPDLYAAIGIHSGAEYLAGEDGCPRQQVDRQYRDFGASCTGGDGVTRWRHAGHRLSRRPRWHDPVPMRPTSARAVAGHR
jgi:poly(hydroxyalkanoate) depolymerase family esterase